MPRGFASLSPERRKLMAQRGAQRLHQLKKAHQFTSEEAKAARGKAVSQPKEEQDGKAV